MPEDTVLPKIHNHLDSMIKSEDTMSLRFGDMIDDCQGVEPTKQLGSKYHRRSSLDQYALKSSVKLCLKNQKDQIHEESEGQTSQDSP